MLQSILCYIINYFEKGITAINITKQTGFNSCVGIYNK